MSPVDEALYELRGILKDVLWKMAGSGHLDDFTTLLKAIHLGKMPTDCLPLLLCFELAKFKSLVTTTNMTYSDVTLQFWRLLYRLLGGAVIRALSGPKNVSQVVTQEATKGLYDPLKAKVNFAVPSESVLRNIDGEIKTFIPPGIIPFALRVAEERARTGMDFILSFDAKAIGPGVSGERNGDVDCWGTEMPTLDSKLEQFKREMNIIQSLEQESIQQNEVTAIIELLEDIWGLFSRRLRSLHYFILDEDKKRFFAAKR